MVAEKSAGCLYVVATPIGNLEDITLRALRVLKEADLIACEDTRRTRKLLSHFEIRTPLESYHEHNERSRAPELVRCIAEGARVALVSDAGMPLISDPGEQLISLCIREGLPVIPIPGVSAITAALAASGMPANQFLFAGFLPARAGERRRKLESLARESRVIIFYEAPHRIAAMLRDALEIFGNREAVIARELTKVHEEFRRGSLANLLAGVETAPPRGEITLIVAPGEMPGSREAENSDTAGSSAVSLAERVAQIQAEPGFDKKTALKLAAKEFGIPKREAYKRLLTEENS